MAKYGIVVVEDKNADWKVITLEMGENSFQEGVSVNRKDKKGGPDFPEFDKIVVGGSVEGELWQSPTNQRFYLFAPRPKPAGGPRGAGNAAAITKAQDTKREDIKDAQERKKEDIAQAAAFRDATLITVEWVKSAPFPLDEEIKAYWRSWVKFFLNEGSQPFQ